MCHVPFRYSNNGTFTVTTAYDASATLTFNGTAVWVYGAKRDNHGPYVAVLDGQVYQGNGYYDSQMFKQVLFSAVELDDAKTHTVSVTNRPNDDTRPYLDIDYVSIFLTMRFKP